jgi:hypothetical protein
MQYVVRAAARQTLRTGFLRGRHSSGQIISAFPFMDLHQLSGCLILLLGGLCLLQVQSPLCRKLGMALIWLASAVGAYFLTGSIVMAIVMLVAWIFFPVWEMLFVLRQLRVPRHRGLTDARAPRDDFQELSEITAELREAGFEQLDECRLSPSDHEHYYRIFDRTDGLTQATIGYIAQGSIGFHFVAFTSHGRDGRRWVTWDYPLTYGLSMPPNFALYRALHCDKVADLYQAHLDFLEVNGVRNEDLAQDEKTPQAARARLEQTLNQQIEHNISRGYLAPAAGPNADNFSYSWRGTLYVAGQILRDLIF